jgi:hypothetical protein
VYVAYSVALPAVAPVIVTEHVAWSGFFKAVWVRIVELREA